MYLDFLAFYFSSSRNFKLKTTILEYIEKNGAKKLSSYKESPEIQVCFNVAEEISIASGIAMPGMYCLEDYAMNAYVVTEQKGQSYIVVTLGAIMLLEREELLTLYACMFANIASGKAEFDYKIFCLLEYFSESYDKVRSSILPQNFAASITIKLQYKVINYCFRSINILNFKLSDSYVVQFTRNPQAFKKLFLKIQQHKLGSKITTAGYIKPQHSLSETECSLDEIAHMYFCDPGFISEHARQIASYPAIEVRKSYIDPTNQHTSKVHFKQSMLDIMENFSPDKVLHKKDREVKFEEYMVGSVANQDANEAWVPQSIETLAAVTAAQSIDQNNNSKTKPKHTTSKAALLDRIGTANPESLKKAREFTNKMPYGLSPLLHDDEQVTLVLCLLLSSKQSQDILAPAIQNTFAEKEQRIINYLMPKIQTLSAAELLCIFDLCLPAYNERQIGDNFAFIEKLHSFLQKLSPTLFEMALYAIIYINTNKGKAKEIKIDNLPKKISLFLSYIIYYNAQGKEREHLFLESAKNINMSDLIYDEANEISIQAFTDCLCSLSRLESTESKKQILAAVIDIVMRDNELSDDEFAIIRALCETLGLRMPSYI